MSQVEIDFEKRWYIVTIGLRPGVYSNLSACQDQVFGIPHQKFTWRNSEEEACTYFQECLDAQTVKRVVISGERLVLNKDHLNIVRGLNEESHPNSSDPDTPFYVVTRGLEVGIFKTDATPYTTGVREGLQIKTCGFASALETFMSEFRSNRAIKNDLKYTLEPFT